MEFDVKKLSFLARIKLTPEEEKKFQKEFEKILDYVSKLKEVNVSGVEDIDKNQDWKNVVREDEERINEPGEYSEALLKEAPNTKDGYIKVKHIL